MFCHYITQSIQQQVQISSADKVSIKVVLVTLDIHHQSQLHLNCAFPVPLLHTHKAFSSLPWQLVSISNIHMLPCHIWAHSKVPVQPSQPPAMIIVNELYFVIKDEWCRFPLPFRKAYHKISSTSSLHKSNSSKSGQRFCSAAHFLSFPWNYYLHYHIAGTARTTINLHNHFFCISAQQTHWVPPLFGLSSIWTEKACASHTPEC